MIDWLVGYALRKRLVVAMICVFVAIYGYYSWKQLAIEAYPDIAEVTVDVITQAIGLAAEEVEQQVTIQLERELNGTPGLMTMRSVSTFGLSLITLVFRDGIDDYWARQRVLERIGTVELPPGLTPELGPLSPATGEITTQFQLELDPQQLMRFGLSLKNITDAINANSGNSGGSVLNRGQFGYVIRGIGLVQTLQDMGNIVVTQRNGNPILVSDLGKLKLGIQERHGILGVDDRNDAVQGAALLLRGENPSRVMEAVH